MGNGAKAQQKRERNAKQAGKGDNKSQLKANQAQMQIKCKVCLQQFFVTARAAALEEHAQNKHSKTLAECFPDYKEQK